MGDLKHASVLLCTIPLVIALSAGRAPASVTAGRGGLTPTERPVLARLLYYVRPDRKAALAAEYAVAVAPLLRQRGWVESRTAGRATFDSVFSRLFEFATPSAFEAAARSLYRDPAGVRALRRCGARFAASAEDSLQRSLALYERPLGPGRMVQAGSGREHWQTYDASNGTVRGAGYTVLEDHAGSLWFGTQAGGVSRFDGSRWTTFTTADGLASNDGGVLLESRDGRLWVGAGEIGVGLGARSSGVSCYDGRQWTTLTPGDGLASGLVLSILEDTQGTLWFGTDKGVSRYDGKTWRTFTTRDGLATNWVSMLIQDRRGHVWAAVNSALFAESAWGLSRYDGHTWTACRGPKGPLGDQVLAMVEDDQGNVWVGTETGVSRYDGRNWTSFSSRDGLVDGPIWFLKPGPRGQVWLAGQLGGVSCYDGKGFATVLPPEATGMTLSLCLDRSGNIWVGTNWRGLIRCSPGPGKGTWQTRALTAADGLGGSGVGFVHQDREGRLWVGHNAGVSSYDCGTFTSWSERDGLPNSEPVGLVEAPDGRLWISSRSGELACYDGTHFTTFGPADGITMDQGGSLRKDSDGSLWFGSNLALLRVRDGIVSTYAPGDSLWGVPLGLDRRGRLWFGDQQRLTWYDGTRSESYTVGHLLPADLFNSVTEDDQGVVWFSSFDGVLRHDGEQWKAYTSPSDLPSNRVWSILVDRHGTRWISTWDAGLCRDDGRGLRTFTTADGLPTNQLEFLGLEDRDGTLWFATDGGGAIRYDGRAFQTLSRQDGLAGNVVRHILQDRRGDLWFACSGGLTRFRPPPPSPPTVSVDAVVADRRYEGVSEVRLPSTTEIVTLQFHGRSLRTRPEAMVYRYRLAGHDTTWRTTKEAFVEYVALPHGTYTFELQAVDRDLAVTDPPATIRLTIRPPYGLWGLGGGLGLALLAAVVAAGYALRRRRQLLLALQRELQTAHDLQAGLMPKVGPDVPGYQFAGRCVTANHVGGDFYHYFQLADDRLAVCLTDVTGHAMDAAIPAVMFDGILDGQIRLGGRIDELFSRLNAILCEKLTGRTHVAFSMVDISLTERSMRFTNAGCPYACHYRKATDDVAELALDAFPLGVRRNTIYQTVEAQLSIGDYVVLYSDGVAEAATADGDVFGFDRTVAMIRDACGQGLEPKDVIDRLLTETRTFTGAALQADDMTCVVVKVDGA